MVSGSDDSSEKKTTISIFSYGLGTVAVQVGEIRSEHLVLFWDSVSIDPYMVRRILVGKSCCNYYPKCKKKHEPSKHPYEMR